MQVSEVNESFSLDNVVPFFQPIMDIQQNSVWSYECLARLMKFDEHAYLPCEFLHLVERHDLVAELTQTIFNRSAIYFRNINMSWNINISLADISDVDMHHFLRAQLQSYPNPKRISFEVTAKNALLSKDNFYQFAELCQALGVNIIIDHFEQNEIDLLTILSLPITAIKVSGRLFEQAQQNAESAKLISLMIEQSATHKVVLIAEHIELASTLKAVKDFGVRYAQGFYFSQPKASP
ncbi:EAL domain-containing protein [Paraglaciecola aquimarina]|uniref:EAL domain-containing protein n=1 Tax=Paraglaciecola aquimarina TaxID=1235557 RepID=A0ABU3SUM2_9ALTE|nr:EAL domain-containing protein [Paraglaciecola aquimarina]MDU0353694.1 EAL domain-containing protein [Paraglaciecola aquimarina]